MTNRNTTSRRSSLVAAALVMLIGLLSWAPSASAAPVAYSLWAKSGTMTLPVGTTTVYGYTSGPTGATDTVTNPGGPVLTANEGDDLTINFTNDLGAATALWIPGLPETLDLTPVASGGGTTTYTFNGLPAGTYLYEATPILDGGAGTQYQSAMGLHGALVVYPTAGTGQAYASAATAFDVEQVLVLSELDTALTNSANPAAFDMRNYHPDHALINGQVSVGQTTGVLSVDVPVAAGNKLLLRYVNAGGDYHSMATLGLRQQVLAYGGNPLTYPHTVVAETFGPGQAADALVQIPATADGQQFLVYDANLLLHSGNSGARNEGMMASISVGGTAVGTGGPLTSMVTYTLPTIDAVVSDATTGGQNVVAAEYFVDTLGAPGTGTAMTGTFGTPTVTVSATPASPIVGQHTIYVRGQDSDLNWGPAATLLVNNADLQPPVVSAVSWTPDPTDGTTAWTVRATADDTTTGNSDINPATAVAYIDDQLTEQAILTANNPAAPLVALEGTFSATRMGELTAGPHTLYFFVQDMSGATTVHSVPFEVISDAPIVTLSGIAATPNNGGRPFNSTVQAMRVTGTATVSGGTIQSGEACVRPLADAPDCPEGTGFDMVITNATTGDMYADIPLATVNALAEGAYAVDVRAKSTSGAWGPLSSIEFSVDKTGPVLSTITEDYSSGSITYFDVTFDEMVEGVSVSNFLVGGTAPGAVIISGPTPSGTGALPAGGYNPATTGGLTWRVGVFGVTGAGQATLSIANSNGIHDPAGNALRVSQAIQFSTVGAGPARPPGVGAPGGDNADIYAWDAIGAFQRLVDATALPYGIAGAENVDALDWKGPGDFYLSFNNQATLPGLVDPVQDEDVVHWNGTNWELWFDGSANGFSGTTAADNADIDAISIVDGVLYYSLWNNFNPTTTGTGNRSNIFRWDGVEHTVAVNRADVGIINGRQLAGLQWVAPGNFYATFADNTPFALGGAGTVNQWQIVHYDNGNWSQYWDYSAQPGVTAGNGHDLDGISVS